MQDQYNDDEKAASYDKFRQEKKHHTHVTIPSVRKLLGYDLSGKRCVDMACGSGQSTRILADMNPLEIIGVDISQPMIDLAIESNSQDPKYGNIKYLVQDCSKPLGLDGGRCDVVFSMHFLNYSQSRDQLSAIARVMFETTRPGGLCAGLIVSPFLNKDKLSKLSKYGIELELDGCKLTTRFFDGDARRGKLLIELNTNLWEPSWYEKSFLDAGFINFEWVNLEIIENCDQATIEYLKDFIDAASSIMFKATRPE